jgi:hypothetical protein
VSTNGKLLAKFNAFNVNFLDFLQEWKWDENSRKEYTTRVVRSLYCAGVSKTLVDEIWESEIGPDGIDEE